MRRRLVSALPAFLLLVFWPALAPAIEQNRGTYEDPLGRYRFSFTGQWRVGAREAAATAPGHFYCLKRGVVAAELVVSSRPFPAPSRLSDFVESEEKAIETEPDMFKVSVKKDLTISSKPATRLIVRFVQKGEQGASRETLAAQYWFTTGGQLWSLIVLTTSAEQQRSKVLGEIETTIVSSFQVLEPDAVGLAINSSKKIARLKSGLAEITLPETWTLRKVGEDLVEAEFDKGRLYLFAAVDHAYGDTLKDVAHGFLEQQAGVDAPEIASEGACEVRGGPAYYIVFDGRKDEHLFRVQLVVLTSGTRAFFLYGICEPDAWPQARAWITAVQYTINVIEQPPDAASGLDDQDPE